jgi:TrmH family RNA methyltransferase
MALSNEKRKLLERLRSTKLRSREGLFLVEGIRGAGEVLQASRPLKLRFCLRSPDLIRSTPGETLALKLPDLGIPVEEISAGEMAQVSDTETSQGILLVVEEPTDALSLLDHRPLPKVLILDGIQDPGNVGTLLRAAWAFGLDGALALDGTADPWSSKVARASAGAFAHIPVARLPWAKAREWLTGKGVSLVAADAGGIDVRGFGAPTSWALAVGNEGAGSRQEILEEADGVVSIPMVAGADSLNAGIAGAVLLYALTASTGQGERN